jgi:translocation and assembly module TamB
VLDNPEQVGELFYGTVSASGRFTLTGTQLRPVLWIDATADARSELFLTVQGEEPTEESGFIVYLEPVPLLDSARTVRAGAPLRPMAQTSPEPSFLDRLQMLLNISVPEGATVWLVFDPRIGDELRAVGSGRLQLVLRDGRFSTFGTFTVSQGEYRFTARDLFVRRFELEPGGQLRWDGDPINAQLALSALYRTRVDVSPPGAVSERCPFLWGSGSGSRAVCRARRWRWSSLCSRRPQIPQIRARVTQLNQSENRLLEAISVLVTGRLWQSGGLGGNSPLGGLLTSGGTTTGLEFLANQVNLFLRGLLENLDIQLDLQDLQRGGALNVDIALRLFNDRLLIRRVGTIGGGAWSASESASQNASQWFGDLTISFQLNRRMSVEFFHRSGWSYWQVSPDTYGLGLRYRTHFPAWRYVLGRYPQTSLTNKSATPSTIKPDEEPR